MGEAPYKKAFPKSKTSFQEKTLWAEDGQSYRFQGRSKRQVGALRVSERKTAMERESSTARENFLVFRSVREVELFSGCLPYLS